jgi:signal transduction histidine kinase
MVAMGWLTLALGGYVYRANTSSPANRHFLMLCCSISLWLNATGMGLCALSPELAQRWFRIDNIGVMYISVAFYAFSAHFLELSRMRSIVWGYGLATGLVGLVLFSDEFITGVTRYWWGYFPTWGLATVPFFAIFLSYMAVAFNDYFNAYRTTTSPIRRQQIKYVLTAFLIAYAGSVDFLPTLGIPIYPFGYLTIFLLVSVITYAILRYRLLEISLVLRHGAVYLTLIPLYFLILIWLYVFQHVPLTVTASILLLTSGLYAGLFVGMQRRLERAVGQRLLKTQYDAYETLTKFAQALVRILDLETLQQRILSTLQTVFGLQQVSLFLLDKEQGCYDLRACAGSGAEALKHVRFALHTPFPTALATVNEPIVKEEVEHAMGNSLGSQQAVIVETLGALGSEVCIPLVNKEHLVGFINLGHKPRMQIYSDGDLNLLRTLADNAAIALDNAMLYADFVKTQVLLRRADRLRSLETMAGGFAHEIRNPLTSIKTFVQLAPQRHNDPEFLGSFGEVVADDVARIERLIIEILDYARYMTPKFTLENLNEIIRSCLHFVEVKADYKAISIATDLAPELPLVYVDRQQLKQVLMNLILNAVDAMAMTGGELRLTTSALNKADMASAIKIEVCDTGCGIPPEDLAHIFDPFFTTKHESAEREGTGLGLSIVHQILHEHRGTIEVQSTVGKGTTFIITLPVSTAPVDTTEPDLGMQRNPRLLIPSPGPFGFTR